MAEQIAQDPAFAQMTAALQASVAGDETGAPSAAERSAEVPAGGPAGLPTMDAEKYAQAMSNVLQNQHFMEMAEKLGQQIMSVSIGELMQIELVHMIVRRPDTAVPFSHYLSPAADKRDPSLKHVTCFVGSGHVTDDADNA